jgi:homoserine dehydrogenase
LRLSVALLGFGNVGRAFARLLLARGERLLVERKVSFTVTGIATASHGFAIDPQGIDLPRALRGHEAGRSMTKLHRGLPVRDTFDFLRRRPGDVLVEITTLNPWTGLPAVDYIRAGLRRGMHVVTANKGPLAVGYRELTELARRQGCHFRFEGTVLDGVPVFNLVEKTLPGTRVLGFHGIVNSTCNLVLTEMQKGRSMKAALAKARRMGVTEADSSYDIEGWDAAAKTAVLVNVLMGGDIRASEVDRMGVSAVTQRTLGEAARKGKTLKLVARARRQGHRILARVAPELLSSSDPLSRVEGTSNALVLETDTLKRLTIIEDQPGVDQTAYALLSDLLTITSELDSRKASP